MSDINVIEQQPAGGGVNKPASGTYGEAAELAALQQELPAGGGVPPEAAPTPPMSAPGGPLPSGGPAGLPSGLMAPTGRPDVPISTPLAGDPVNPVAGAVDARQKRLALLDAIAESQEASPEFREWAQILREKLIERG